jgi:hypothetical protein
MKKSPKIDLNKSKILFQKRFFTCLSKIFKKFYLLFYVKKTIKECPVPLDISIKSNRKHHKTVLYSKYNKNIVGRLFGQFFVVFGQFFHKNIWSPCIGSYHFEASQGIVSKGSGQKYFVPVVKVSNADAVVLENEI